MQSYLCEGESKSAPIPKVEEFGGIQNHIYYGEESKSARSPKVGGFQGGLLGEFQGGLLGEFRGGLMREFQGGFQDEGEIHDYLFREESEPEIDFDEYAPDAWKNFKFDTEELLKAVDYSTLRRTKGSN